ncbi:MAG: UDP-3-O-(3-hydroxymyristoyl)glucosamine N-acyltransferase [Brevinematales bacterium]|jgi:UDP-3-O-[3-hydroxymyristoyl] glucosamine N-acyltransferase
MKLSAIAAIIKGKLKGKDIEISGVSDLEIQKEGTVAYTVDATNLGILEASAVSAIICPEGMSSSLKPYITCLDPKIAFTKVLEIFSPYKPYRKEIYPGVYIERGARVGLRATILPFTTIMDDSTVGDDTVIYSQVYIGKNVRIGRNCIIKAGVKIDDQTVIGDNVIIHHNTVIGGDGFGYIQKDGENIKIPQIGRIVIGNDVEIGAGVTVDRATISQTVIGDGVKIDNLVQIAHNVRIGRGTVIAAQTGVSGSSTIGANCVIAGQVGIADHVTIKDNVLILAKSGIVSGRTIEEKSVMFGTPARDAMEEKRIHVAQSRLPELIKTVGKIKKKIGME